MTAPFANASSVGVIQNAANTPLNQAPAGTIPYVETALLDYFQPMEFTVVTKTPSAFQVIETGTAIAFRGIIQPLSPRRLELKPEGQRAWTWIIIHADTSLQLNVDDVVLYNGKQTRVMARSNFTDYGYMYYEAVQDWLGSGP